MQSLLNLEVFEYRKDAIKSENVENGEKVCLNKIIETLKTVYNVNTYKIIK